jgi:hypothetical protein
MANVHFPLGRPVAAGLVVKHGRRHDLALGGATAEGGTMELKMRLNVLAAIVSFGFLAAIVFGMV